MNKQGTILIVDDNKGVLTAVQLLLKNYFTKVITLASPVTLPAVLREEAPEVVLLDMNFTSGINNGNEGLFWLHEIKKLRPALPVVLFTAYADIDLAVRGIKEGATDFIVKPWDNQKLVETLQTAVTHTKSGKKKSTNEEKTSGSSMYWVSAYQECYFVIYIPQSMDYQNIFVAVTCFCQCRKSGNALIIAKGYRPGNAEMGLSRIPHSILWA